MGEIAWTEETQRWLEEIFEYIAADNPAAAGRTVKGIFDRAQQLKRFPEIGYRYLASSRNVRILLYGHYRIAYPDQRRRRYRHPGRLSRLDRYHSISAVAAKLKDLVVQAPMLPADVGCLSVKAIG